MIHYCRKIRFNNPRPCATAVQCCNGRRITVSIGHIPARCCQNRHSFQSKQLPRKTYCNERADTAAKSALSLPITIMKLPARELIPCASKFCFDEWQDIWDCCEGNKLILFTPRLALSSVAKIFPATIPSCSTDCELVILVSLTHTY